MPTILRSFFIRVHCVEVTHMFFICIRVHIYRRDFVNEKDIVDEGFCFLLRRVDMVDG